MRFQPGEGSSSRVLLRDCETLRNLREPSFEALVFSVPAQLLLLAQCPTLTRGAKTRAASEHSELL